MRANQADLVAEPPSPCCSPGGWRGRAYQLDWVAERPRPRSSQQRGGEGDHTNQTRPPSLPTPSSSPPSTSSAERGCNQPQPAAERGGQMHHATGPPSPSPTDSSSHPYFRQFFLKQKDKNRQYWSLRMAHHQCRPGLLVS